MFSEQYLLVNPSTLETMHGHAIYNAGMNPHKEKNTGTDMCVVSEDGSEM